MQEVLYTCRRGGEEGRAGQGRGGQGRARERRAGQGRAGQGRAASHEVAAGSTCRYIITVLRGTLRFEEGFV